MHDVDRSYRSFLSFAIIALKGFCMGVADVIPGVSGGTIAFLFGIYEDFIAALKSINIEFLKTLLKGRIKEAFDLVAWRFLLCLLTGILTAVFTLAGVLSWLLSDHYVLTQSFFFGLILATGPIIIRRLKKPALWYILPGCASAAGMYLIAGLVPVQTPNQEWILFLSGMLAICAMILPGISGAFILLLIGKYQVIIQAVHERDLFTIGIVAAGCVVGILTFVRVLSWLLKRFHDLTLIILAGLVVGSLRKIWPWKINLQTLVIDEKVVPIEQANIMPGDFSQETLLAIVLIATGFLLGWLLNQEPDE